MSEKKRAGTAKNEKKRKRDILAASGGRRGKGS
jgi:hypothetical protein